jgi:hypothetical protein
MRAIVYIDGFNFYYSIRFTPYRWVNPVALCELLFPSLDIQKVKYFTAKVKPHADDPDARNRQAIYLRALETLEPKLAVYEGHFLKKKNWMPLAVRDFPKWRRLLLALALGQKRVLDPGTPKVRVWKTEEKGSDVNLASHLIVDAFEGNFEEAVVVSNDGDLEYPLRYVREMPGSKKVTLCNAASFRHERLAPQGVPGSGYKRIRHGPLSVSQFPVAMQDAEGSFHRPPGWDAPKKR